MRATPLRRLFGTTAAMAAAVTLVVAPSAANAETYTFSDVNGSPFSTHIMWLAGEGISTGYPDGTFRPQAHVTRDAMAAFLYRLKGSPEFTPPAVSPFVDITPETQFYKEITWLVSQGITTGYPDSTYRPLQPVNRDAMAAFMYRFYGSPAYTPPVNRLFEDVTLGNSQFYKEISWLGQLGISNGYDTGWGCRAYRQWDPVQRDGMAAFMYRLKTGDGRIPVTAGSCNPPTRPNPGNTKDCGDFGSWAEAQDWFDWYFRYHGDVAKLDANKDGVACENLPGAPKK